MNTSLGGEQPSKKRKSVISKLQGHCGKVESVDNNDEPKQSRMTRIIPDKRRYKDQNRLHWLKSTMRTTCLREGRRKETDTGGFA